jgi:uncharacterized Tic20 family protein
MHLILHPGDSVQHSSSQKLTLTTDMFIANLVGIFNVFVGLMLVAAFLLMGSGLMLWYLRLGTYPTYRDSAIEQMKWAVTIMFVLVVLLGIAQFVQRHTAEAMMAIGVIIAVGIALFVLSELTAAEEEKKDVRR